MDQDTLSADEQLFAPLSPALLARKGGAKPAMRSQLGLLPARSAEAAEDAAMDEEDLGWNDLGESEPATAQIIAFTPAQTNKRTQRSRTHEEVNLVTAAAKKPSGKEARSSFTLRLDPERHMKLRLACTLQGCSAQVFVTNALDRLLGTMPDVQRLAAQAARS